MSAGCPHKEARFCPLYVALHGARTFSFGCDDGELGTGACAVSRRMDYVKAAAKLEAAWPGLIAECRFKEEAAERDRQRRRNMRLLGLH